MCPEGGLEENEKVDARTKPASWRRERRGKPVLLAMLPGFILILKYCELLREQWRGLSCERLRPRKPRSVASLTREGRLAFLVALSGFL